jgi:hypothetical protein
MKTFDATIVATITMSVDAETKRDAMDIVHFRLPSQKLCPYDGRVVYHLTIEDIHLTEVSIMDGSTSHDKDLIMQINRCYVKSRELFYDIIRLLANRDADEFDDSIDLVTDNIKDIAYYYLHAIADDQDLQTIANYCRV